MDRPPREAAFSLSAPGAFDEIRAKGARQVEISGYTTAGGVTVERGVREVPEQALEEIVTALGEHRGGAFSSGMDYPRPLQPMGVRLRRPLP